MKKAIGILGALAVGAWLSWAARAQETTVMPPSGMPLPAASATPAATASVHAAKAPKGGAASFLGSAGGSSTNRGGMTITSDRIEFDYKEMVIAFDANVHVVDPQYEMRSDRMLVFLEGTNQIKRIIAIDHVDISQPDRHATCDRAVYERASGEMVMTGNPVLTRGADRVTGAKITVFVNDSRVIIEGGGRVNLSPETMKSRDIKP